MPSAPRPSCVRCVITSSRLYTTPSVTLRRHKAAAASSSSSARALNYEYARRRRLSRTNRLRFAIHGGQRMLPYSPLHTLITESFGKPPGSRYFCESLFWASKPKQTAKLHATVYACGAPTVLRTLRNHLFAALHNSLSDSTPT
ncbi:hypothetical protein [Candidatus Reidiella endopervernicosa]|uniref:Uncharacterized protein n=1 Tax=Candidatus Reidiella endopervernicosa TaxID=2738883 RepID=A0A6N0HY70_9GAMM|nr:hypothetical protein [Candidatus Reidiella endopervernicosa]QKQ27279.1 hypothetical protein HUE57_14045 [Candidatus Reidiella endopervernicosa]